MAEALGYKVKSPDAISGYIFRKFDDVCAYGLMKRQRGFVKVTDVAIQATDPYDAPKAREGKAKAINQIPIVREAFTQWHGEIPQETAFPSKLKDLIPGVSWQEVQKHSEGLRRLFTEVFPYLRASLESTTPSPHLEMRNDTATIGTRQGTGNVTLSASGENFGFTKTLPFTRAGIKELRNLVEFLETQVKEEQSEESRKIQT